MLVCLIPLSGAVADDTDLYILTQAMNKGDPDAMIVLDLSGSMNWTPAGSRLYVDDSSHCSSHTYDTGYNGPYFSQSGTGHTYYCDNIPYSGDRPIFGDSTCSDTTGFYKSSGTGHTTNCSRLAIAKRALFNFLDTDNDGVDPPVPDNIVNHFDQDYVKIRMGYMRFYNCNSAESVSSTSYSSGCNTVIWPNPNNSFANSTYSQVYCNNATSCIQSDSASGSISGESATGGTPLAAALNEAKYYFDYTKNLDTEYKDCRQKFVILITDGSDTFACPGTRRNPYQDGSESNRYQYMGRRETVGRARELANAGYYVFVVGFGANMPYYQQNTLNWAAYFGKTKNTAQTQSTPSGYDITAGALYPTGVSNCSTTSTTQNPTDGHYYANSNDPGEVALSGYAFIAQSSDDLNAAIATIRNFIVTLNANTSSYVAPVVPISQFQSASSEDLMYLGMFKPTTTTMWKGNIKKYGIATTASATIRVGDIIDASGALAMDAATHTILTNARSYWSASADGGDVEKGGVGKLLQDRDPDSRNIYTYFKENTHLNHSSNAFSLANRYPENAQGKISTTTLGVTTAADRDNVINFAHGWDAWDFNKNGVLTEKRDWVLGSFIHSRPAVIHYPNYGYDVIYAGANDGMLHAFKDSKQTTGDDGTELWGFIPPDLLERLKNFGSSLARMQIFVDGSPKAYVKYIYNTDGSIQSVDQAILIFGERRGGNRYYALDVANPTDPVFLWSISPTEITSGIVTTPSTDYQELGQSWSTPQIGKIRNGADVNGNPIYKMVAFIGGGYDNTQPTSAEDTTPAGTDTSGRAVYVIDIANGNRIWGYTSMTYCVPGDITAIDSLPLRALSGDGLIDRLYIGNVKGEIWRFDLCSSTTGLCVPDMSNTSNWTGRRIFAGNGKIFYPPDVTFEPSKTAACSSMGFSGTYNMLFFGTGDREKPNNTSGGNRLYALKDYDILPSGFTTIPETCLTDVTAYGTPVTTLQSSMGWYIRLSQTNGTNPNPGEKCTGQAVALGGAVYYTTFTPTPSSSACSIATGSGNIYILQYQTGMAFFDQDGDLVNEEGERSISVVAGLPSGIIVAVIGGASVNLYGGVPDGVIPPEGPIEGSIVPIDWRILFN